jgi:hypothetical protein
MMVIGGGSYLVWAEHILAMLCHTDEMDTVMFVPVEPPENHQASGSEVTSCSNKILNTTLSFRLRTSSNTPYVHK